MLEPVKDGLKDMGVQGITVTEVKGFGRQGGHTETYRGAEYEVEFIPKLKIEVLCDDVDVDRLVKEITSAAHTGEIGDGKIWVTEVKSVTRIRTGEVGREAL